MDAFVGEIRLLPYKFAPEGWLWCNGTVFPIQQYQALYAVIGNIYGGQASQQTFAVPDLRGCAVVSATRSGSPPGLTPYTLNQRFGAVSVTAPLAAHTHTARSGFASGEVQGPSPSVNGAVGVTGGNYNFATAGTSNQVQLAPQTLSGSVSSTLGVNGAAAPHTNQSPYLALYFAINWNGVFPVPAN